MTDTHGLPDAADPSTANPSTADFDAAGSSALATATGKTTIAGTVVSKVAGIATKEVVGVPAVNERISRTVGTLRERIPAATVGHGRPPARGVSRSR